MLTCLAGSAGLLSWPSWGRTDHDKLVSVLLLTWFAASTQSILLRMGTQRLKVQPTLFWFKRYGLRVAPVPLARVRSPSDAYCCNPWMAATVNKITALFSAAQTLALALTGSQQSLSYTHHTSLDVEWSKWTLSFHISVLKTELITANTFPYNKEHNFFLNTWQNNFHSLHKNTSVDLRIFIFDTQTVPKINSKILRPD